MSSSGTAVVYTPLVPKWLRWVGWMMMFTVISWEWVDELHNAVGNFPWDSDKHRRLSLAQVFFSSLCCVAFSAWVGMLHHRVTAMSDSFSIRRNALSWKYGEVSTCTHAHKSWYFRKLFKWVSDVRQNKLNNECWSFFRSFGRRSKQKKWKKTK